jgi:hypothetical protein
MSTPRGQLRPDTRERERPPSERFLGHLPGVAEGVAHAPSSHSTIIRAASAAAQSAAAFSMTATAHRLVRQWFAVALIVREAHRQRRRSVFQVSGLRGTTHTGGVVPPFCPQCPLARAAIN